MADEINSDLPEDFLEQVKQALEQLYDFPYLQRHPLAELLATQSGSTGGGQGLRRAIIDAIEALNPGAEVFFRSAQARLYNLLHLHYVEAMTIQESAHELSISERQAYRDLKRGQRSVAEILWAKRPPPPSDDQLRANELSSVQSEVERLDTGSRPVDISALVKAVLGSVERLAEQHNITLDPQMDSEAIIISTDAVIARQVLTNVLSNAIQRARSGPLQIGLERSGDGIVFRLDYLTGRPVATDRLGDSITKQLDNRLGWSLRRTHSAPLQSTDTLNIKVSGPSILIIDDNAGLVQLLDRYLTGHNCHVVSSLTGAEGLTLAEQIQPDAIVLDVMMPEMDGWELLQRLRNHPQTKSIPVIICTVFNDPELAYSLGASLFLPKPVNRADVLDALRRLGVV
jgi:CheY-like chemotaxis protein